MEQENERTEGEETMERILDSWIGNLIRAVMEIVGMGYLKILDSRKVKQ